MNELKKSLKCTKCLSILDAPVLLSCGHLVCKIHIDEVAETASIICSECGSVNDVVRPLAVVKAVDCLIKEVKLGDLYFGDKYQHAFDAVECLDEAIKSNEVILADLENHVVEKFKEFETRTDVKRENLKKDVDNLCFEMLEYIDDVKCQCLRYLNEGHKKLTYSRKEIGEFLDKVKMSHKSFKEMVNNLEVDEKKWRDIEHGCKATTSDLKKRMNDFLDKRVFHGVVDEITPRLTAIEALSLDFTKLDEHRFKPIFTLD